MHNAIRSKVAPLGASAVRLTSQGIQGSKMWVMGVAIRWKTAHHFKIPEATVVREPPYRSYATYLARKHTPVASAAMGRYFSITRSAATKMGTRLNRGWKKTGR